MMTNNVLLFILLPLLLPDQQWNYAPMRSPAFTPPLSTTIFCGILFLVDCCVMNCQLAARHQYDVSRISLPSALIRLFWVA
jgi:hypothetical protein